MLLSLLSKDDKINFINLLSQILKINGAAPEVDQQVQKKYKNEMGDEATKIRPTNADPKKIIDYFTKRTSQIQNIVYLNLFAATLEDEWYNAEQHFMLDEIQQAFGITQKKRIELMKIVYADRDLKERAKRIINE